MATAFTGSPGWTALHPLQLGGPPLVSTFTRPLASTAKPLIAHIYDNDGVTFKGTVPVLNWTAPMAITANGGFNQVTLSLASITPGSIYGQVTYGQGVYGAEILTGNIIRLTEQGGPWPGFIYGGVVEDIPDSIGPTAVSHDVLLTHFAFELDDIQSTSVYSAPVDVAQIVRDAVAQCFHCACDQVSVPASTGILVATGVGGTVDFRNQTVKQQIDTARSMAGPTWFWYVDELGRVWFQSMGSAAAYTIYRGPNYETRSTSASITQRKNRVTVVGGVPSGGSLNAAATYNGTSQTSIGMRALFPNLSMPNITDQGSLQNIANNVGVVLDRVWRRLNVTIHPPFVQRIHGSQPGGAMLRYWEPAVLPLTESETTSGMYTGPFIVQSVQYDGLHQVVVAGDIPITSQTDVQNMITAITGRIAGNNIQFANATLNKDQTLTGSFQSGTKTLTPTTGAPATFWSLGQKEFSATDPGGTVRAEMGNLDVNGVSPAQWGFRANDSKGAPIFDSALGVIKGPTPTASNFVSAAFSTSSTTPVVITSSAVTITPTNQVRVLILYGGSVSYGAPNTQTAFIDLFLDGVNQSAGGNGPALQLQYTTTTTGSVTSMGFFTVVLSGVSHTIDLRASQNGTASLTVQQCAIVVFQTGVV